MPQIFGAFHPHLSPPMAMPPSPSWGKASETDNLTKYGAESIGTKSPSRQAVSSSLMGLEIPHCQLFSRNSHKSINNEGEINKSQNYRLVVFVGPIHQQINWMVSWAKLLQTRKGRLQNPFFCSAVYPDINHVPISIFFGQAPPFAPILHNIQHCI